MLLNSLPLCLRSLLRARAHLCLLIHVHVVSFFLVSISFCYTHPLQAKKRKCLYFSTIRPPIFTFLPTLETILGR